MLVWFKNLGEWTYEQIASLFEMSAFEFLILISISLALILTIINGKK